MNWEHEMDNMYFSGTDEDYSNSDGYDEDAEDEYMDMRYMRSIGKE